MSRTILVSLLMLLIAVQVSAAPELKGTPEELTAYLKTLPETVALTAADTMDVEARQGTVTIGVLTEDASLKKALMDNQSLRQDIASQLVAAGISQDRIVGAKFSSIPEYGLWGKKPKSYKVDNTLKITVESDAELHSVAGMVDKYDTVFYRGMALKHGDKESIRQELRSRIMKKLSTMKTQYEQEFGLKLVAGRFEESIMPTPVPLPQPRRMEMEVSKSYLSAGAPSSAPVSFGESNFRGTITVEYLVKHPK